MPGIISPSCKLLKPVTGDLFYLLFLYAFAALLLLFCTPNSPLFSNQSWVDPNVYMDVGRALRTGRVLYRDVFDHKGPLFLMIFAVLAPISRYSLLGLYLLQTGCLGTSLVFLYKMSRLFLSRTASFFICVFFPFFLLSGSIYCNGGGSTEEILLPCFMGSLYLTAAEFMPERAPIPARSQQRSYWFHGLFWGISVLTKINLAVFFTVGSGMLLLRFLLKKDYKGFGGAFCRFLGGVFLGLSPYVVYLAMTGSLTDFYKAYIHFNLIYASSRVAESDTSAIIQTLMIIFIGCFAGIMCSVIGFFILRVKNTISTYALWTIFIMFLSMFLVVFGPGTSYWYYCIPFVCFAGLGEIGIALFVKDVSTHWGVHSLVSKHPVVIRTLKIAVVAVLSASIIAGNGFWRLSDLFAQEQSGVERTCRAVLTSWVDKGDKGTPDVLLYHSAEIGFYSHLGTSPAYKFFYTPAVRFDLLPDFLDAQDNYVKEGLPDYVICISGLQDADFGVSELNDRYVKIGTYQQQTEEPFFDNGLSYIFLYQKQ